MRLHETVREYLRLEKDLRQNEKNDFFKNKNKDFIIKKSKIIKRKKKGKRK
jgi:hypothetical protein